MEKNRVEEMTRSSGEPFYDLNVPWSVRLGDVVTCTNTGGRVMPSWDGYGDWNVAWSALSAGGLL